jgi:hypothetical protein
VNTDMSDTTEDPDGGLAAVDLYWIPLGAGQHVVRLSGKLFEATSAWLQQRPRFDLYHSALVVVVPEGRFVVEQTPVIDVHGGRRGVVVEGPVGSSLARRFRLFRYEVRRWRDGVIPDIAEAVSFVRVADDLTSAERILDLVPSVPPLVWGRDERHTGDMWNSNSVVSWLLTRAGIDAVRISPPPGGRALGWDAGITIASYDGASTHVRSESSGLTSQPTRGSDPTSRIATDQTVHHAAIPSGGFR